MIVRLDDGTECEVAAVLDDEGDPAERLDDAAIVMCWHPGGALLTIEVEPENFEQVTVH